MSEPLFARHSSAPVLVRVTGPWSKVFLLTLATSAVFGSRSLYAQEVLDRVQPGHRKMIPAAPLQPRAAFRIGVQRGTDRRISGAFLNGVGIFFEAAGPDDKSTEADEFTDDSTRAQEGPRTWLEYGTIEEFIFGKGSNSNTPAEAGELLKIVLRDEIETLHQVCNLTAAQRRKLALAGSGDIQRFLSHTAQLKSRLQKTDLILTDDQFREWITPLASECQQLTLLMNSGLFSGDSLFLKTTNAVLTSDQKTQLVAAELTGPRVHSLPDDGGIGGAVPDVQSKPYVIHYWATWCAPSRGSLPLLKELVADGGCVVGMHPGKVPIDDIAKFMRDEGVAYPVLVANTRAANTFWRIDGCRVDMLPYCIVVDAKGFVAAHGLPGPELLAKYRKLRDAVEKPAP